LPRAGKSLSSVKIFLPAPLVRCADAGREMFLNFTPTDAIKDSLLTAYGFSPALVLPHLEAGLVFGFLNLCVVIFFRVMEFRYRCRLEEIRLQEEREARHSKPDQIGFIHTKDEIS
jgi:hypothetical protein